MAKFFQKLLFLFLFILGPMSWAEENCFETEEKTLKMVRKEVFATTEEIDLLFVQLQRDPQFVPPPKLITPIAAPMSALKDTRPLPMGHVDDIYYAGSIPMTDIPLPLEAHVPSFLDMKKKILETYPQKSFKSLPFRQLDLDPQTLMTTVLGKQQAIELAMQRLKLTTEQLEVPARVLGEGGYKVAVELCPKEKSYCLVVKISKADSKWKHFDANQLTSDFNFELTNQKLAKTVFDDIEYHAPFQVMGGDVPILGHTPPSKIARVAEVLHAELLSEGLIIQRKLTWPITKNSGFDHWLGIVNSVPDYAEKMKKTVGTKHFAEFKKLVEMLKTPGHNGPELYYIARILTYCDRLKGVGVAVNLCGKYRLAFNIPDDFWKRVRVLEEGYRRSSGPVIAKRRQFNKKSITANQGRNKQPVEVGLDYNHGANVAWSPSEGLFVIFDQ